ncbi:TPA: GntR family transcriptional regulator [Klebsiella pneumoniae]|nr:GntR family transcriptional regulator [Klebsiella pneumoniae]
MNIPDEGFFTLLTQGMRNRTVETLQRALYHTLRDAILQGSLTARCRLPGSRVMAERLHLSRNTVNAALEQLAQEITVPCDVLGGGGGMHLTVAMEGVNDRTLAQQARQFQLAPAALSHFYLDPQRARSGLVLGYGNTSASRYFPALRTLNRLIAQHRRA